MSRKQQLSSQERAAWAALVLADTREQLACRPDSEGNVDNVHLGACMYASNAARLALRDKFGQNLDTIFLDAQELWDAMYEEGKKKIQDEKKRHEEIDRILGRPT
jgi:hypothetical protein